MEYSKDVEFAIVFRDKPISKEITNVFREAFNVNKKLFLRNPDRFKIIVCDTEKRFREQSKYYYFKWSTATVLRNGNLVTRSPEFIEEVGRWRKEEFSSLMKHEINHVFWTRFYGLTKPCWILEGLACYVGKNFLLTKKELQKMINKYEVNECILDYRYLKRNFLNGHQPRYSIWAKFVEFISDKYHIKNLIEVMDAYIQEPTLKNYEKAFKEVFTKTDKELFSEFVAEVM
ncbi:MAG: hypothetical protein ACMXYD_01585 [Candidatus Woesearchaeota archaeon]